MSAEVVAAGRTRGLRSDATWDALVYEGGKVMQDRGCEVSPSCLRCPLEKCRYDVHGGVPSLRRQQDVVRAKALKATGCNADTIARVLGRSRREVFRLLVS